MLKRNLFLAGGAAALGVALIALPGQSAPRQECSDSTIAKLQQKLDEMQAKLAAKLEGKQERLAERLSGESDRLAQLANNRAMFAAERALAQAERGQERMKVLDEPESESTMVVLGDDSASWLGVESQEVSADKAKELKLPAERGVLLGKIVPDSPAAKAGLKDNDVITEINGQRVEGETQFRRMIHEIPAGRTAQFTIWRDGRAQTISVTLGKSEDQASRWFRTTPRSFSFELPRIDIPEVIPDFEMGPYGVLAGSRPRLGIDAEDLNGQFGSYFGAPDGEGVLVREVDSSSPAEKAGMKSGDVITSVNGERVRSLGELREKLSAKREDKSVKLGILRNRSEMSLTVELPPPSSKKHTITHRTNI